MWWLWKTFMLLKKKPPNGFKENKITLFKRRKSASFKCDSDLQGVWQWACNRGDQRCAHRGAKQSAGVSFQPLCGGNILITLPFSPPQAGSIAQALYCLGASCCSALQCVAVRCSALQGVAVFSRAISDPYCLSALLILRFIARVLVKLTHTSPQSHARFLSFTPSHTLSKTQTKSFSLPPTLQPPNQPLPPPHPLLFPHLFPPKVLFAY